MSSLIKKYPKGLSPAMKQAIPLLPLSHPSTTLPTLHPLLLSLVGGFKELRERKS